MKWNHYHDSYTSNLYKYFDSDDAQGIILPYEILDSNSNLEFIGLLPKNNINSLINGLNSDKLNNLLENTKEAGNGVKIELALPRFNYEYEIKDLIETLRKMGVSDVFNPTNADLSNAFNIDRKNNNLYVDTAIHKTKIELGEKGTKAAAVTYFGIKNTAIAPNYKEIININFNKPFIYMIREKNTKEIVFFGSVYEPNVWTKNTCDIL